MKLPTELKKSDQAVSKSNALVCPMAPNKTDHFCSNTSVDYYIGYRIRYCGRRPHRRSMHIGEDAKLFAVALLLEP